MFLIYYFIAHLLIIINKGQSPPGLDPAMSSLHRSNIVFYQINLIAFVKFHASYVFSFIMTLRLTDFKP